MFQSLLLSYYLCDAAAGMAVLDHGSVARCIGVYQALKAEFLSEEELEALRADPLGFGGDEGNAAYLRFTAWEEENADAVARYKASAEAYLTRGEAGF